MIMRRTAWTAGLGCLCSAALAAQTVRAGTGEKKDVQLFPGLRRGQLVTGADRQLTAAWDLTVAASWVGLQMRKRQPAATQECCSF